MENTSFTFRNEDKNMHKNIATPIDEHSFAWIIITCVGHQLYKHRIGMPINKGTRYLKVLSADVEFDGSFSHVCKKI